MGADARAGLHGQAGESCAPEIQVKRAPAHAGSLRISERLAFVAMFMAMAGFVVGLSLVATKSGARIGGHGLLAAGSRTEQPGTGGEQQVQPCSTLKASKGGARWAIAARPARPSAVLNARLTAALRAAVGSYRAHLSVGVIDTRTGAEALFHGSTRYRTAGIARTDILAALWYRHQQSGTTISDQDADRAAQMIKNDSSIATTDLWQAIGRGTGLATANRALGLRHTTPGMANAWALTSTTLADQLQLLADLAEAHSPLEAACRHYELGLMSSVTAAQRWGIPAAASPGTGYAVCDGRQRDSRRYVVNSVGIIDHGGHELLVVVLSQDWRTEAAGTSAVRSAAIAAASSMTKSPRQATLSAWRVAGYA
jgi:hypothetical protein